jgi:hypothetical protein
VKEVVGFFDVGAIFFRARRRWRGTSFSTIDAQTFPVTLSPPATPRHATAAATASLAQHRPLFDDLYVHRR